MDRRGSRLRRAPPGPSLAGIVRPERAGARTPPAHVHRSRCGNPSRAVFPGSMRVPRLVPETVPPHRLLPRLTLPLHRGESLRAFQRAASVHPARAGAGSRGETETKRE